MDRVVGCSEHRISRYVKLSLWMSTSLNTKFLWTSPWILIRFVQRVRCKCRIVMLSGPWHLLHWPCRLSGCRGAVLKQQLQFYGYNMLQKLWQDEPVKYRIDGWVSSPLIITPTGNVQTSPPWKQIGVCRHCETGHAKRKRDVAPSLREIHTCPLFFWNPLTSRSGYKLWQVNKHSYKTCLTGTKSHEQEISTSYYAEFQSGCKNHDRLRFVTPSGVNVQPLLG